MTIWPKGPVTWEPIDFEHCEHMPLKEWDDAVEHGLYNRDDGTAYYATQTHVSNVCVAWRFDESEGAFCYEDPWIVFFGK